MTAGYFEDDPRAPFAAHLYDLVRKSAKSLGGLPPTPSATSDLAGVLAELTAK